jgi:hypothetical protein
MLPGSLLGAGEIATQLCDLQEVVRGRPLGDRRRPAGHAVQDVDLGPTQGHLGRAARNRPFHHRQPDDDAQDGQQVGQPFGRAQPRLLGLAPDFKTL